MKKLLRFSLALALTAAVFAPAAAGSAPACAAEASGAPHAALVVGTGGSTTTYCVALDASSVSGIHLIQLARTQFGLQYRLGFGGQAVCQLAGVGPTGGDCFGDYPDFWGYWHGDGHGAWSWAGSGAASASISDGDMEGWTWGSGDSATTHAHPPALAFEDVCEDIAPSPTPTQAPTHGGGGDGDGEPGGDGRDSVGASDTNPGGTNAGDAATSSSNEGDRDGDGGGNRDDRSSSPAADEPTKVTTATPITAFAAGLSDDPTDEGGPPIGALLAVIGVAALGAGGWFLRRRQLGTGGD
ncbi:MAG TPA: hypothetical protein VI341_01370 [Actinomycetota bacterium]